MPTLLIQDGFKFFFYANEHLPRHIHVTRGDDFAKVDLETVSKMDSCMKPASMKKALQIIE